jgi:protein O-mannosyl-transferase
MRTRIVALLLVLTTLAFYLPVRSDAFVYDDYDYVVNNQAVQNGLTWAGIQWAFTTFHSANWHPLTWISLMLDCQLFGMRPGPMHVVNVLFHSANATLLLLLLLRWTGALGASAIVAALFALHPLHVESVAWISERKDVLSTFFGLLTLLAYTRYVQSSSKAGLVTRLSFDYLLALICFVLGLMAKPMLVTLPILFLLLDLWPLQRFSISHFQPPVLGRLLYEKWPFFLLSAASCLVTLWAQQHGEAVRTLEQIPLNYRLENALVAYALYLLKMVWPAKLAVYYPMPDEISGLALTAAVAVLVVISATVWLMRERSPYLLVGWLWFLGTLIPVIGLVQVGSQALADRYTYFPLIGMFIAIVFGMRVLINRLQLPQGIVLATAAMVLGGYAIVTESQLSYWQNGQRLFLHALATTPNNAVGHFWLGKAMQDDGKLTEALAEYREYERLWPNAGFGHDTIAGLLIDMGKPKEALPECRLAIQSNPNVAAGYDRFGMALAELGRYDEAIHQFKIAARLDPSFAWSHFYMAKTFAREGHDAAAADEFRKALRIESNNVQILTCAAQLLSASMDPKARNGPEALALALKADDLTGHTQPTVLDVLGMAYAETGKFDEAQQAVQKAIDLAAAAGTNQLPSLQQRLELFQIHKPWRQSFQFPDISGQGVSQP